MSAHAASQHIGRSDIDRHATILYVPLVETGGIEPRTDGLITPPPRTWRPHEPMANAGAERSAPAFRPSYQHSCHNFVEHHDRLAAMVDRRSGGLPK